MSHTEDGEGKKPRSAHAVMSTYCSTTKKECRRPENDDFLPSQHSSANRAFAAQRPDTQSQHHGHQQVQIGEQPLMSVVRSIDEQIAQKKYEESRKEDYCGDLQAAAKN